VMLKSTAKNRNPFFTEPPEILRNPRAKRKGTVTETTSNTGGCNLLSKMRLRANKLRIVYVPHFQRVTWMAFAEVARA